MEEEISFDQLQEVAQHAEKILLYNSRLNRQNKKFWVLATCVPIDDLDEHVPGEGKILC